MLDDDTDLMLDDEVFESDDSDPEYVDISEDDMDLDLETNEDLEIEDSDEDEDEEIDEELCDTTYSALEPTDELKCKVEDNDLKSLA